MHFLRLGEANCSACQPLDPDPEVKVLAYHLLRVLLAHLLPACVEVAL